MLKLQPTVGTMTNKNELQKSANGTPYIKVCIAVDEGYYWSTLFGASANYIDTYANVGAQIFIEDWSLKKTEKEGKSYYDFIINKCRIVKNGGDK